MNIYEVELVNGLTFLFDSDNLKQEFLDKIPKECVKENLKITTVAASLAEAHVEVSKALKSLKEHYNAITTKFEETTTTSKEEHEALGLESKTEPNVKKASKRNTRNKSKDSSGQGDAEAILLAESKVQGEE